MRKVANLGLKTAYSSHKAVNVFIKKVLALPYLPAGHILPAYRQLTVPPTSPLLHQLMVYINRAWLQCSVWSVAQWSVYQLSIRTNNDVEVWHRRFNGKANGNKLHFYKMVPALIKEAKTVSRQVRQSLEPKLDLINVELQHLDILCFTETWLKPDVLENDVLLDNFVKPFRHDRVDRIGGGVAVYVKSYLSAKRRCDLEVNGVESVWLELKLKQNRPFLLGTFYRPPNSSQHLLNLIEHSFDLASDTGIETILIVGDFNDDQMSPRQSRMKEIFTRYGMTQFVEEPTNFCENSASIIDLVLRNNSNAVDLVHVGQPFLPPNIRYHSPVYGILKFHKPSNTCFKRKIWLYDRGDYDVFRKMLSDVNWNDFIESSNNVDSLVERFSELLIDFASKAIPNKIITVRKTDPPWMNNYIHRTIRKRNRIYNKAKKGK
ncbi:unnamed protein product [Mytilus coruscus]|uniref:Endonuclease/exonuclease/phosphatase domain-containing protein n=1 Tax=Mytilus coruscus TaxID=42192 RepID=A0A6J8E181_MYTCO|nr:unnamed protein product [Mytilus coruscus]